MTEIILALLGVGLILVISEYLLKHKVLHGEVARKFVHITAGTFIATWAFYLDTRQIQILSGILLVGVLVSKFLNIFGSVHGVVRKTWGEVFFAIGIGFTATLAPNEWVYMAAILHMSIADGLAAIVGNSKLAKKGGYKVFGHHKTLAGTMAFYFSSLVLMAWLILISPADISNQAWLAVIWIPLLTTITENFAAKGLDNLAIPMVVIGALQILTQIHA